MAVFMDRVQKLEDQYQQNTLDRDMIKILQDAFCRADRVYAVCLSKSGEKVTEGYGTEEEKAWIQNVLDTEQVDTEFWEKLLGDGIETVVEQETKCSFAKVCALAIRVSDKTEAVWLVTAFLSEKLTEDVTIPAGIMTTTEENYYKSLELLDTLSRQYFSAKWGEMLVIEAFQKNKESAKVMEQELRRSETLTEIVRMLESKQSSSEIVEEILQNVQKYLELSGAALVQSVHNSKRLEIVCKKGDVKEPKVIEECPYFTGRPYMISSDSIKPEEFTKLFEACGIKAAVYLPLEVNGKVTMYLCFYQKDKERNWDVTEIKFLNDVKRIIQSVLIKKIAQDSLESSYASLEAILENVGCGIYVRDPEDGSVLYTNQCYRNFFPDKDYSDSLEEILRSDCGYVEYYAAEENRWFDVHDSKIDWVNGKPVKLYTVYDVTDKKLYQQKIEFQANNDFLTGLYNRMRCEQDLEQFIRQTKELDGQGALLYIDLDDFKHINDGLGHQYGDVLLQSISHSLQRIDGIENTCYRMGGDEFIIIITHTKYHKLQQILDDIHRVFSRPWFLKGADYYCTMSMGLVRFPMDGDTVEELIKKADIAMYEAKKTGKNRIKYYDDTVETTSFKRLDLEKKMRNATMDDCKEFIVYFQPIMGVNGECQGAEALVRWKSAEIGLISPAEFVPLAEYLGLINPIGDFVLEEACRHLKYWNDMGHPNYQVNVNLSVVQLLQNDIVSKIQTVIKKTRIEPSNLVLEVTESLAVNDMVRMKKILSQIKELGVRVAMDDFGTGYSSLNHVREMPLDIIKIDRCFVIDLGKDQFSESFIKMVAELATTIGVKVCVEGVENKQQYDIVSDMKIQQIQGFYYDRPMDAQMFEEKYV